MSDNLLENQSTNKLESFASETYMLLTCCFPEGKRSKINRHMMEWSLFDTNLKLGYLNRRYSYSPFLNVTHALDDTCDYAPQQFFLHSDADAAQLRS